MTRNRNGNIRKVCSHSRRQWPKCDCSWYFNYKRAGGRPYRFGIDKQEGKHVEGKTEAQGLAASYRSAIDAGTFKLRSEVVEVVTEVTDAPITLSAFIETIYLKRRGRPTTANDRAALNQLAAFVPEHQPALGITALSAITTDQLELFYQHQERRGLSNSSITKTVQGLTAMIKWAVRKGHLAKDLIAESDVIRRKKGAQRSRRLRPDVFDDKGNLIAPGEEALLMKYAGVHLQRVLLCALTTGMRRGEILSLQWKDVDLARHQIVVLAAKAKTRMTRVIPITTRLEGILDLCRTALDSTLLSAGEKDATARARKLADLYPFGDESGQQVKNIKRAFASAVLRAHGHQPKWTAHHQLTPESKATFQSIGLRLHDLRHEAGSRWLEAGMPIHHVQHLLGHTSLAQTGTYLNATAHGLHASIKALDPDAVRCTSVAKTEEEAPLPSCNDESLVAAISIN